VINPDKTFDINIEWQLTGNEVDLYLNHDETEDNWRINAFAETMGPGEDLIVYRGDLPKADGVEQGAGADYKVVFTHSCHYTPDPGPKLQEHIPNANSGVYKLVITVFLNNRSNMGYDIAGFHEGPMIMAEPLA
jgi:hypothetical protein